MVRRVGGWEGGREEGEIEGEEGNKHGEREKQARLKIHSPFCSRHSTCRL